MYHTQLGGLGARMFGFTHHTGELLLSPEELAAAWRPYIETCIAAGCSASEKQALFARTATKFYRLG